MPKKQPADLTLGIAQALIRRITTTTDGGISVTVDIASTETDLTKRLLDAKAANQALHIVFTVIESSDRI